MTAALYVQALRHGCCQVLRLRLPPWQKLLLIGLKAVAITGYFVGKLRSWSRASNGSMREARPRRPLPSFLCSGGPADGAVVVVPACIAGRHQAARLQRLVHGVLFGQQEAPAAVVVVDDCSPVQVADLLAEVQGERMPAAGMLQ